MLHSLKAVVDLSSVVINNEKWQWHPLWIKVQCSDRRLTPSDASVCRRQTSWGGAAEGGRRGPWGAAHRVGCPMKCLWREKNNEERAKSSPQQLSQGGLTAAPTWCGLLSPPRPPGQDKLVAVIFFPLADEPLVLVARWPLLDEIRWGTFSVQALAETASGLAFDGPLGLRQHGALKTHAGQILQGHAGWRTNEHF